MEKTLKCSKYSHKIIIKNKKAKKKSLVIIKKHESYCKGDKNYVMRDKVDQYADKMVVVTNALADNNHLESSRKHYTAESGIFDSIDESGIFGSTTESGIFGSTAESGILGIIGSEVNFGTASVEISTKADIDTHQILPSVNDDIVQYYDV